MKKITSINQLRSFITEVRSTRKGFVTNFFLDEFKHGIWIDNGDLFYLKKADCYLIVRQSDTFCNVFYIGTTIEEVMEAVELLKTSVSGKYLMFDIVGRNEQCKPVVEAFRKAGFEESTSLVRMIRKTIPIAYDDSFKKIQNATEKQAEEVYDLLHQYFVAENEQLPYVEELKEYARLDHIHVYVEDGKVIGFMIYEKNASTLYWRYWFVNPDYRERHIGSLLFHRLFFEANDTARQLLWVIRTNENAKKRQEHYGFAEENMYDYVMKYNS